MRLKSILNRVEPHAGFVYEHASFASSTDQPTIEIAIRPRRRSRATCSGCGQRRAGYDRLAPRRFEFVPLWGLAVVFVYAMRQVDCPQCGVKVEQVPWGDGKNQLATSYRWFLARWARRLSWSEVAAIFHTSWDSVCRGVEHAVTWGLAHRDLSGVSAVGIDEVAWRKGHSYLTLVYDISGEAKRLLAVAEERTEASLRACLTSLGKEVCAAVEFVASDMWQPYLKVIGETLTAAVHVLDRFHVMQKFGQALDDIRAEEAKQLKRDGYEPVLTKSRWCLLKRPAHLTDQQSVKLAELLKYNLRSVRAYLLREDFQRFWEYVSPTWAGRFLDEWTTRAMRSKLKPLKNVARTLRRHRPLILNWFRARGEISAGAVEGLNNKVKLVTRKSYGFRTPEVAKLALFHNLGRLPEPEFTHKFC